MEKVRWGILSTAKIAVKQVIPAMQQGNFSKVVAISSRSMEKATRAAKSLNIESAVGSYADLLAHPDVDAIYNPLPNHLHIRWSVKALRAGKHVLCEKPIGLSLEEAQKLATEAKKNPGLKAMEAFMYRHHPQWINAKELVASGTLGEVQAIHSFFSYYNDDPQNIRNKPEMGGGSLMDIGCYCISVPRFLFDAEPYRVLGSMEYDPDFEIDRKTAGILEFSQGTASFTCATQLAPYQCVRIYGTKGRLEIPIPFNPPADRPTYIQLTREGNTREISFEPCNHYTIQGDLFSKAIIDNKDVPTSLDDALANMKVLDSIVRSDREKSWIPC